MARQPPIGPSRELAVVLHDLVWLFPRTIDLGAEVGLEPLPPSELEVMRLVVLRNTPLAAVAPFARLPTCAAPTAPGTSPGPRHGPPARAARPPWRRSWPRSRAPR